MIIAVVDGQGGGIGKALVAGIKAALPDVRVIALGTNSMATGQMLRAGADDGATGENAIIHNLCRSPSVQWGFQSCRGIRFLFLLFSAIVFPPLQQP